MEVEVRRVIFMFLMLLFAVPVYADGFKEGVDAYKRGDYKTAVEKWELSAREGSVYAQNNLGAMYEGGIGVKLDYVEACKWYEIAGKSGHMAGTIRRENRIALKSKMTPAQIEKADHLANEWMKKYAKK